MCWKLYFFQGVFFYFSSLSWKLSQVTPFPTTCTNPSDRSILQKMFLRFKTRVYSFQSNLVSRAFCFCISCKKANCPGHEDNFIHNIIEYQQITFSFKLYAGTFHQWIFFRIVKHFSDLRVWEKVIIQKNFVCI